MENINQNFKSNEEIDLIELLYRIIKSIKSFFNWLLSIFKNFTFLLIRKSLWIFSFTILGGILGYLFYSNTPRFYSSEMIARSNSMNNYFIISSINLLNDLFDNKNYSALGNYLGITPEEAKKIKSIDAFYGIDVNKDGVADYVDYKNKYNPKDTTQRRINDIFYLRISVFNENVFKNVREGIKKYISTNPFILENNEIRKTQAIIMIKKYESEIQKLDSFQRVMYFEVPKMQKAGSNQMVLLNEKESKLYHKDILELNNSILFLERELAINPDPITVIQDFTQLSKADNNLMKILKMWVITFAIIGFMLSLLWQHRANIISLLKDNFQSF